MVCRDVLALMDRVSLMNGLKPVRDMPMSLLEYTAGTSPNVWIRTAYCNATFSVTLSSLTSVFPTKRKARPLQTCQAARWPTHASATIACSTVLPANRALHPVPCFPRPDFPGPKVGSVQVHNMSRFTSAEITVRPPAETPQRKRAGPSSQIV